MASKAVYKIVGVSTTAQVLSRSVRGAPSDARIVRWARAKNIQFAARYFPSRKGWVVYDLRNVLIKMRVASSGREFQEILGLARMPRTIATEDAAVMLMLHMRNPPKQETLNL